MSRQKGRYNAKGRGHGGGGGKARLTDVSKAMSYLLRHGAEENGLPLDASGFAKLADMQKQPTLRQLTVTQAQQIVEADEKMRFTMKQEGSDWYIRANQGHSMKSVKAEALLTPITSDQTADFPIIAHGTYTKFFGAIQESGLNKMSRNHIHFSPGHPGDPGVYSGRAASAQLVIEIDLPGCLAEGIPFFISDNRVVLSPGPIPSRLFKQVYKIKSREVIYRGCGSHGSGEASAGGGGGGASGGSVGGGGGAAAVASAGAADTEIAKMEAVLSTDKTLTKTQRKNMKRKLQKKKAALEAADGAPSSEGPAGGGGGGSGGDGGSGSGSR